MDNYTYEEMGVQGKSVEELCTIGEFFGVGLIIGALAAFAQVIL